MSNAHLAEDWQAKQWHLKKEINVGHLLTTLMIAAGLLSWGMTMDARMTRVEVQQTHTAKTLEQIRETQRLERAELIQEIRLMRDDLRRLAERNR